MKTRLIAAGFVLGAAAALVCSQALSQQGASDGQQPEMPMPSPDEMQAIMKAWDDAMKPGEPHKGLGRSVGSWDTVTKIWMMGPAAPPTETHGTSEVKSVLGGRFVLQNDKSKFPMPDMQTGEMKMVPWEGMGLFGYDNYQKVYVGCWADDMGTQLLTMRGNMSQDGKTLTMYGEMDEPMLGVKGRMVKYVTEIINDDHHVFSVYDLHAGDNYKVVEVAYTRKK
jgi:hypothetical protein